MNLFKPVFWIRVYLKDGKVIFWKGIQLIVATELDMNDVIRKIIVSNVLCIEIKQINCWFWLSCFAEQIIHFFMFSLFECDDSIEGIEFNSIITISSDDLSLFALLFLFFNKRTPSKNMPLHLVFSVLV